VPVVPHVTLTGLLLAVLQRSKTLGEKERAEVREQSLVARLDELNRLRAEETAAAKKHADQVRSALAGSSAFAAMDSCVHVFLDWPGGSYDRKARGGIFCCDRRSRGLTRTAEADGTTEVGYVMICALLSPSLLLLSLPPLLVLVLACRA
jgi:hypothetical protein